MDRRSFFRNTDLVWEPESFRHRTCLCKRRARSPRMVQAPDIRNLPFTMDNGIKVFNLIAEPVKQQIAPNKTLDVWGFNGSAPGPTIQITQGDRVRIIVDNRLPEPTSMHWHGFEIPHNMDGGPGISQDPIPPGGPLCLRVHSASGRNVLLSLAHGDAGNDGHARRVHHASQNGVHAARR